jgi:hypothetical protein
MDFDEPKYASDFEDDEDDWEEVAAAAETSEVPVATPDAATLAAAYGDLHAPESGTAEPTTPQPGPSESVSAPLHITISTSKDGNGESKCVILPLCFSLVLRNLVLSACAL